MLPFILQKPRKLVINSTPLLAAYFAIFGLHLGIAVDFLTAKAQLQLTELPSYLWLFPLPEELKM